MRFVHVLMIVLAAVLGGFAVSKLDGTPSRKDLERLAYVAVAHALDEGKPFETVPENLRNAYLLAGGSPTVFELAETQRTSMRLCMEAARDRYGNGMEFKEFLATPEGKSWSAVNDRLTAAINSMHELASAK